jgi:hypothetical protein
MLPCCSPHAIIPQHATNECRRTIWKAVSDFLRLTERSSVARKDKINERERVTIFDNYPSRDKIQTNVPTFAKWAF